MEMEVGMVDKAKESSEIEKLRHKLEERLDKVARRGSPDALEATRNALRAQLSRKGTGVTLKHHSIKLVDKSTGPAQIHSKFVKNLMEKLHNQK